jgi:hypothetical protein
MQQPPLLQEINRPVLSVENSVEISTTNKQRQQQKQQQEK